MHPFVLAKKSMRFVDKIKSNLYQRLVKEFSTTSASDPFAIWSGSHKKVSKYQAMAAYKNWAYSGVRAIADEIAFTQFKVLQVQSDNTSQEVEEHEALDLLEAPNQHMTGEKLRFLTASHLELVGNAYWYLYGVKSETDKPSAIFILNPKEVEIIRGDFPELVKGYKHRVGGKSTIYQPHEIIHFDYADPDDPIEGIGTIQAIYDWIEMDDMARKFNFKFFQNGARLSGLITHPSAFNKEQLEFIKKSFEQIYSGVENAYRTAVLPTGADFKQVSASPKEMDFQEGGKNNRDQILGGLRVPKTALGLTEDVNRANAEATDYVFETRNTGPKRKLIIGFLNEFYMPRFGEGLWLSSSNEVPEDKAARTAEMQAATGNQPIMSINEARSYYFHLDPIENGDEVRGDLMKTPVGAPAKEASKPVIKGRAPKTRFAKNIETRKKIGKEIADKLAIELKKFKAEQKSLLAKAKKDITSLNDGEWEILYKAFSGRVSPYEKKLRGSIQDFNDTVRKEVLDNVGKLLKSIKAVNPDDLFDQEKATSAITDLASPILTELYTTEATAAAALLGIAGFEVLSDKVTAAIERAVGLLGKSYTDSMRELLKTKLTETMAEGPDLEVLKKRVNEIFDFQNEIRAEQVAVTETFRIGNEATVEAWRETGVVKSIKWYTAEDERVCDDCGPMQDVTVGIDEIFYEKGDTTATGKEITYDDVAFPPLHVSCRCYVRPEDISID